MEAGYSSLEKDRQGYLVRHSAPELRDTLGT